MDIIGSKPELLKGLSYTQSIVEKKSTMPILANCCLEAKARTLTISATDLEVGVMTELPVETKQAGKITVLARNLFEIIKSLPEDRVHLKVLPNHRVQIRSGTSDFKMMGLPADEFPSLPVGKSGEKFAIAVDDFLAMITKSAYAMSADETRYNLNGVYLEPLHVATQEPRLRLVATDGHRLAYADRPAKGKWSLPAGVLIPRKGILEWKRLLEGAHGSFALELDQKYLTVHAGAVTLVIRLIDGQFPPYQQVIPTEHKWLLGVEREALQQALRRVQLVTTDRTRGVKFKISPGHLEILAQNPDVGEAHEELSIHYKGETFEIGFNARYFLDVLSVIADEQVLLELKGDMGPCVVRSEFDKAFLAVIMPMRI